MKYLALTLAVIAIAGTFTSCDKDESTGNNNLSEETLELVGEITTTERLEEEINRSINEAIGYSEESINTTEQKSANITDCADITIKPLRGFPKTITIDFGDGCTGSNGFLRSGSISVTISDTLRTKGTTYSASFNNFSIEGYLINGSVLFENTSEGETVSFYQEMEITFTGADGIEIEKTKTADRAWIEGSASEDVVDDIFTVSGSCTVYSSAGGYYSYDIIEPIYISYSCDFISEGVVEITSNISENPVIVDFGNRNACDWKVYVSQDKIINKEVDLNKL